METTHEERVYSRNNSVVFRKTNERFGGLSNMSGGYPIYIHGGKILTSEALYQACRFPHMPEVQSVILNQTSPMTAKMKSKPYRKQSRNDWDEVRIPIMRWCLRVKLFQNWAKFGELLKSTGNLTIVEESMKDKFWGAKPVDELSLIGVNALGRLLMEVRSELEGIESGRYVLNPPNISDFYLLGREISSISFDMSQSKKQPDQVHVDQFKLFE